MSDVTAKAAKVEAVVFDVDGVLTRGDIIYGPGHAEWKVFNVQDGHGFMLAHRAGLKTGMLTGRDSEPVHRRAKELQVTAYLAGRPDKGVALRELAVQLGVEPGAICFVGDDVIDLPAMKLCGFAVAVHNAVAEVKERAAYVTGRAGGDGAAREVIELILKAKGLWQGAIERYVEGGA